MAINNKYGYSNKYSSINNGKKTSSNFFASLGKGLSGIYSSFIGQNSNPNSKDISNSNKLKKSIKKDKKNSKSYSLFNNQSNTQSYLQPLAKLHTSRGQNSTKNSSQRAGFNSVPSHKNLDKTKASEQTLAKKLVKSIIDFLTLPFSVLFFVLKMLFGIILSPFVFVFGGIFKLLFGSTNSSSKTNFSSKGLLFTILSFFGQGRIVMIRLGFALVFAGFLFRLADLQVLGSAGAGIIDDDVPDISLINKFTTARRGQIYIQDINQNRTNIPITATKTTGILWFNPKNLASQIKSGLNQNEVLTTLASSVNVDLSDLKNLVQTELERENKRQYSILFRGLDSNQKESANFLITDKALSRKYGFGLWLGVEERESRYYPESELLASTTGYTPNYQLPASDAAKRSGCEQMVIQNQSRRTDRQGFVVGEYGIEQKYCSVLGGINGRKVIGQTIQPNSQNNSQTNTEANPNANQDANLDFETVVDGADVYLTIDKTLQRQAELILGEAMEKNRALDGSLPRDGCIMVTEVDTGKILAMATAPSFDPNNYQKAFVESPMALRNTCTNDDYEVGSVMKPLAVAAAMDVNAAGVVDKNTGKRLGVGPDFKFTDYDSKGKLYRENNGNIVPLRNAEGASFQDLGQIGLKECLRDSINTCIADVAGATGNKYMMNYFEDRFLFGKPTKVDLPGDLHGNTKSFEKDLLCDYCWATKSFGQGFSLSPLQLVRAFSPIANNGLMVEPHLVSKIECSDGTTESYASRGSCVPSNLALGTNTPKSVISKASSNLVAGYMQSVLDEGFKGGGRAGGKVEGYKVAAKSGTAQVSRPIVDKDGKFIKSCSQTCNTEKGIYDHTYLGFNMGAKRYFVMVKISEPNRGLVKNFSSTSVAPYFAQMMSYTLSYMGVPKDR